MKAISMKCSQEQFKSIKPKLEKNVIEILSGIYDDEWPYLINHYKNDSSLSIGFSLPSKVDVQSFETWDEKVFLEACGIEVEPKFEITKETVLKYQMKDEFPECFEVKLEVGKYMKTPNNGMYCLKEKKDDGFLCYGFNINGKWDELFVPNSITKNDVVATTQEIQQAFEKEVLKRYKKGDCVKGLYIGKASVLTFENTMGKGKIYIDEYYSVWMSIGNNRNEKVFDNGNWASIMPQYTQQEAEEKFNFKTIVR